MDMCKDCGANLAIVGRRHNCRPKAPPKVRLRKRGARGAYPDSDHRRDYMREYMKRIGDMGLLEAVYVLVGVGPLRSEKAAEYMRTKVPGVVIPDEIVDRLRKTPKERKREEGKRICAEIIQQVREIDGVDGVHVMAYRQEDLVAEIIEEAGLFPRPRKTGASDPAGRARPRLKPRSGRG